MGKKKRGKVTRERRSDEEMERRNMEVIRGDARGRYGMEGRRNEEKGEIPSGGRGRGGVGDRWRRERRSSKRTLSDAITMTTQRVTLPH